MAGLPRVDTAGPIVLQQPRHRAVSQHLAAGLAARAVVGLVLGIPDPLHRRAARPARLAVLAVNREVGPEGRDVARAGELRRELLPQRLNPVSQRRLRGLVERRDLVVREPAGPLQRRQARRAEELVGVGVADAAEQPWIGQAPLQRVVLSPQRRGELLQRGVQRLQPARLMRQQAIAAATTWSDARFLLDASVKITVPVSKRSRPARSSPRGPVAAASAT